MQRWLARHKRLHLQFTATSFKPTASVRRCARQGIPRSRQRAQRDGFTSTARPRHHHTARWDRHTRPARSRRRGDRTVRLCIGGIGAFRKGKHQRRTGPDRRSGGALRRRRIGAVTSTGNDAHAVEHRRPVAEFVLADDEREMLPRWPRRAKSSQALLRRCRTVLGCTAGKPNKEVATELDVSQQRWASGTSGLLVDGLAGLADEPRTGAPRRVSDQQSENVIVATVQPDYRHARERYRM
jgi:hypothetical protein